MKDNIDTLYEKFELRKGSQYAGGSAFLCRECHSVCYVQENYIPCQDAFIPVKVVCPECRTRWKLELTIEPEEQEYIVH